MKVKVLYFAAIRENVNIDEEEIEIEGNLEDLLRKIAEVRPSLASTVERILQKNSEIAIAVNATITNEYSVALRACDEIAFIPPISGG